ncbi:hypothetical protein pipiens_012618 [Culex pipiens pipiens]|uniref:Vesicle associated protein n=1 Tax=Culex pipiens pipiens TaxID=38569 RepID=A0ABD1D1L1_CULPP
MEQRSGGTFATEGRAAVGGRSTVCNRSQLDNTGAADARRRRTSGICAYPVDEVLSKANKLCTGFVGNDCSAPNRTKINTRGVLGLTWCPKDFDLVASCGKDNKIHCWNQNSEEQNGEILSELATTNQWNFDVAWCPRNPALIAGSSFDGNVTVYSINGGAQSIVTDRELIERSNHLEQVLAEGTRSDACVRRNL